MTALHFRVARVDDSAEIAQLVNEAYRPAPGMGGWTHESDLVSGKRISPEKVESLIKQEKSTVLVGVLGSMIVTCVHIESEGANSYIGMLAVSPSLQGLGKGKEVLAHAEEYAVRNFSSNNFVMVVVAARTELVAFYLRRGYKKQALQCSTRSMQVSAYQNSMHYKLKLCIKRLTSGSTL